MTNIEAEVMVFGINLLVLAIPTAMLASAWTRLVSDWQTGVVPSIAGTACLAFASASTMLAIGSLFWQVFVGPIAQGDYRTEVSGLLLSVVSLISGFAARDQYERRYWGVGLGAAAYICLVFVFTAFSYK